jgi:hypothetical protein
VAGVTDRDEIERGLLLLVEHGGNSQKAAESEGCVWASSTLRKWRQENPELYRRVELAHTNELEDATKARAQEIAHQAGDLEKQLLNKVAEKIDRMDGREAAQAARAAEGGGDVDDAGGPEPGGVADEGRHLGDDRGRGAVGRAEAGACCRTECSGTPGRRHGHRRP